MTAPNSQKGDDMEKMEAFGKLIDVMKRWPARDSTAGVITKAITHLTTPQRKEIQKGLATKRTARWFATGATLVATAAILATGFIFLNTLTTFTGTVIAPIGAMALLAAIGIGLGISFYKSAKHASKVANTVSSSFKKNPAKQTQELNSKPVVCCY